MAKRLYITNERMLQLVQWAIENNIAANESEYYEMIGFVRNNISKLKSGEISFTKEHIMQACRITGASADYVFGFTNTMMRRKPAKPLDLLKEAVVAVQQDYKDRENRVNKKVNTLHKTTEIR